jgi:hypothetical protein
MAWGATEGRAPNAWFDAQYYRANNPDLDAVGLNGLVLFAHYEQYGYMEGRAPSATYANFDEAAYLADYSDLGTGGITADTALNHYLTFGIDEGRVGKNDNGTTISSNTGSTFTLTDGADITGVNAGATTTAEALTLTDNITMTAVQWTTDFATNVTAAGVTITNFDVSNDQISTSVGAAATSNGVFINNYDGSAAQAVGLGGTLEIDANSYTLGDLTNTAAVLVFLTASTVTYGPAVLGQATIVVYDGAGQAGIYQADETTGAGTTAFDTLELIGIADVAGNAFVGANFT